MSDPDTKRSMDDQLDPEMDPFSDGHESDPDSVFSSDSDEHQEEDGDQADQKAEQDAWKLQLSTDNSTFAETGRVSSTSGSQSGKYILRSARHPDPLHFIHRVKMLSTDIDPEMEELVTIIRSTETKDTIHEEGRKVLHSIITSELIRQFEGPGDNNVNSETGAPTGELQREETAGMSSGQRQEVNEEVITLRATSSHVPRSTDTAPIASLSDVDLSDSDDSDHEFSLKEHSASDDVGGDAYLGHKDIREPGFDVGDHTDIKLELKFEDPKTYGEHSSNKPALFKEQVMDCEEHKSSKHLDVSNFDDFDLHFAEEMSPSLNLEASKQKAKLRQCGSLAKRRKPTRTSVRTSSQTEHVFSYEINKPVMNGYDVSMETSPSSQSEALTPDENDQAMITNVEMSVTSQVEDTKTGKNIQGIKTAIVQPELVKGGRQRLRSVPTKFVTEKRSDEETTPKTPPWLLETKLRPTARPLGKETEKLKQSSESETPPWLKEAMAKKRRSLSRISQSSTDEMPIPAESHSPVLAPWMQEASLRRTQRLEPLSVTQKDFTDNANNIISDSAMEDVFDEASADKNNKNMSPVRKNSATRLSDSLHEQENMPPQKSSIVSARSKSSSDAHGYLCKYDKLAPVKNVISPSSSEAKNTSSSESHTSPTYEKEPAWKAEIALRRKSKSYVVAQKPEMPLKLGEMPQWKKDLLEKAKQRRASADSAHFTASERKEENSTQNSTIPPWKLELAQRRGSSLSSTKAFPEALETLIENKKPQTKQPEEEPEWAQLVARRRQRLASSGLLPPGDSNTME